MLRDAVLRRVNRLHDFPAMTTLKLFGHQRVRAVLGERYSDALHQHRPALPNLSSLDAGIVDGLERDGVFVTSLEALGVPGHGQLVDQAADLAAGFAAEARDLAASGKVFMIVPPERIVARPSIYRWGLDDRLLDIAEAYIGLPPAYDGATINYTVGDGREVATRMWHRDREDRRMLKIAIYLHDVGEDGGPFQLISRQDTRQSDVEGYSYDINSETDLAKRLGANFADHIVTCNGAKGTVIFSDTARFFHRGKPFTGGDRAALFYSYFSKRPRHPFLCDRSGISGRDVASLVEGLPARQRSSALWRRELPAMLKLVRPVRV